MSPLTLESRPAWQWWLASCLLVAPLLIAIGDHYPFSPFPMYSKFDSSADILYVTDQNDKPLALSSLFGVGSAQAKKRFERELLDVAKTRDYEKADAAAVTTASTRFLNGLWKDRKSKKTNALGVNTLRLHMITVSLSEDSAFQRQDSLLGEISVTPDPQPE